jgi:hypothetical protein
MELMTEYSEFRDQYEKKFQEVVGAKEHQINELKRKMDIRGLSGSKNENISERDELIEELKEKVEAKDKIIADLKKHDRQHHDSLSSSQVNCYVKLVNHIEVWRFINHL